MRLQVTAALWFLQAFPLFGSLGTSENLHRLTAKLTSLQQALKSAAVSPKNPDLWTKTCTTAHRKMRNALTVYVQSQLNTPHVSFKKLEHDLTQAIEKGIGEHSWVDNPAYVHELRTPDQSALIIGFALDFAAGGSMSVIQIYRRIEEEFVLTSEGGSELNDCAVQIMDLTAPETGEIRFFAHGAVIASVPQTEIGILYAVRDGRIVPLWHPRAYRTLTVKPKGSRLTLEYVDPYRFARRAYRKWPYTFRDVYQQTETGVQRVSHKPIAAEY